MDTNAGQRDLDVRRLSGSLGAEIRGIVLGRSSADDARRIHELLLEHLVLFFPDQHLNADEHIALGRHFGELEAHPNLDLARERPEFFELRAVDGAGGVADEWHSDLSCSQRPSKFSILQAKVVPPVGGDTMWTNAYKAYDELSAPLRDLCDGLTAFHNAGPHLTPERGYIHPVVRVHPEVLSHVDFQSGEARFRWLHGLPGSSSSLLRAPPRGSPGRPPSPTPAPRRKRAAR